MMGSAMGGMAMMWLWWVLPLAPLIGGLAWTLGHGRQEAPFVCDQESGR